MDGYIKIFDCGYRGRAVVVGEYNPRNKTFIKKLDYLRHFFHNKRSFGNSVNVIDRLSQLGCEKLMYIEKMGDIENVYYCDFWRYSFPGCYTEDTDVFDQRRNYTYDRTGHNTGRDRQRFVDIRYWRVKKNERRNCTL